MSKPIYVYYRLDNFYQNHRRYARSRNDDQLNGKAVTKYSGLSACDPVKSANGSRDPNDFFVPCGLIAASVFNDTFSFGGGAVSVSADGIAWQSDVKKKFKDVPSGSPGIRILNPTLFPKGQTDERFIVWMRIAGLPSFRKLWGKIDQDIAAGPLSVVISSTFPVSSFSGKKYLVLSTTSWAGGKNNFLGIAYIVVGCLAIAIAVTLFVLHKLKPRRLGDPNYLRWK